MIWEYLNLNPDSTSPSFSRRWAFLNRSEFLARLWSSPWHWVLRYGLAYVAVAAGFGLRVASTAWTGPGLPTYITFYPAVMVAALLAGFGPGLLATALAAATTAYWILPPEGFAIASPVERLGLVLFSSMGLFMSVVAELFRRSRRKAAAYDREMALRETREWLRVTLTSIGDGVIATDQNCRITFMNPIAAGMTGWKPGESLGQPVQNVFRIVNEKSRQPGEDIVARALTDKRVVMLANSTALVTKDGREIPIEDSAAPILDAAGSVVGVVLVFHDVTEKRRTQTASQESAQRMNRSQEMAHLGSWELDLVNDRLSWSDEVYRIFGLQPQEFGATYRAFLDAVHPDDRGAVAAAYADSLQENRDTYEINHRVVRRSDGEIRFVHEKCEHIRDDSGRIIRSVGMVHDITERKHAERALRRAKEEWERTFDSVPDMIAIMDDRHRILRANRAMAERLGCTPEECIGEICYQCVHGTTAPPALCPHVRMLADGQGHIAEIHEERLGGDFVVSTTPLLDDRGKRIGAVHVARDITELRKRENELHRLNRTLKALGRSNQALIRVENETDFLNEACRIIVEDCGHPMVWIGYAEQDEAKSVRPVAYAGFEEGYLEMLEITWADTERGRGPTGSAIRTGKPCACVNMLNDPKFAPWREEAVKRGYASSAVLPLLAEGQAFGAITIYFEQSGALSEHELALLTELADDVAYGVGIMRLRDAHARAEAAMRSSEERMATFAAATFEGIVLSDDGRIVDCNEQFAQIVGCGAEELKGVLIADLIVTEDRERVMENIRLGRESLVEHGMLRKDGTRIVVEAHGRALSATDFRHRHTAVRDITERKQAEEALREARDQLEQRVLERTTELRATYEELKSAMIEQRRLEAEILEISNSEKQRIGQDLHDGLTQHLNGILYMSETLRQRLVERLTVKPSELARLTELLRDGISQARDLAHGLNPVGIEPDGLVVALKRFAGTVRETFKISCQVEDSQPITLQDDKVATHLYRIAQESVQNAIKHGKATRVVMRLREDDNLLTFEVRDNGVGLTDGCQPHSGMGLHIMRYRARACGGDLILRKGTRGGTRVICSVPLVASEKRTAI